MKTNSQQNNSEPSPLKNEQQSRVDTPEGAGLRELFQCFLVLEADGKSVNKRKADLFVKAKADGYDPKALRTAFRQRVREMEYLDPMAKTTRMAAATLRQVQPKWRRAPSRPDVM